LDDVQLFDKMRAFLESGDDRPSVGVDVDEIWDDIDKRKRSLLALFRSQIMRPRLAISPFTSQGAKYRALGREPPDIDQIDAEQLVENLDAMAYSAFSGISEEVGAFVSLYAAGTYSHLLG
jgi:hypothetical protein